MPLRSRFAQLGIQGVARHAARFAGSSFNPAALFILTAIRAITDRSCFHGSNGFLVAFFKRPTDGHSFPYALHGGIQKIIGVRKLFESEPGNLSDYVVNGRLKSRFGIAGNVVKKFIERVTHRQLGGDFSNGKARGLGGQGGRTGYPGIHFNHDHAARFRVHTELDVRTARIHPNFPDAGNRGVAHTLIFFICQGLGRSDCYRIPRMDTHRVHVFDGADDDHVILEVAHDLHFVFFPAQS